MDTSEKLIEIGRIRVDYLGCAHQAAPDFLYSVGVSTDGTVVAAGCENVTVRLYNGTNDQLVKPLMPPGEEEPMPPKK